MVTGIELAGVILAILPVLIDATEQYDETYSIILDGEVFRAEYASFVNNLRLQNLLFRQLIEPFLRSITTSDKTFHQMLKDETHSEWENPKLTERLEMIFSLPGDIEVFCSSMNAIKYELNKLKTALEKFHVRAQKSSIVLDGFTRLQFCFKKKRLSARLDRVAKEIATMGHILDKERSLQPMRRSKPNTIANVFDMIRTQASSLHRAITKAWQCTCKETHASSLLLERRAETESDWREVAKPRHIRVTFLSKNAIVMDDNGRECFGGYKPWYTVSTRQAPSMSKEKAIRPSLSQDRLCGSNFTSGHDQSDQRQGSVSSSLSHNASSTQDGPTSSPETVITTPESEPVIQDLCDILRTLTPGSSFLGYIHDEQNNTYHTLQIDSPKCSGQPQAASTVSLRDLLCWRPESATNGNQLQNRGKRLSIALVLAYSVLEFYSSPWLFKAWKMDDIYFFTDDHGIVMTDRFFILSESYKTATSNKSVSSSRALESLGILILELWFGASLESRPSWKRGIGSDGLENEHTTQIAAMDWQKEAANEGGLILHGITRRCIYGDFGLPTQCMEDEKFVRAVYEGVVLELETLTASHI